MTQWACKWSMETAKQNQILEISFGIIGRDGLEDLTKLDNDNVYGNASYKGWCNLDAEDVYEGKVPLKTPYCDCRYDGVVGSLCEQPTECSCINQCSNNGFCQNGFCAVNPLTSCGLIDTWCSRLNQCNFLYNSAVACSIIFVEMCIDPVTGQLAVQQRLVRCGLQCALLTPFTKTLAQMVAPFNRQHNNRECRRWCGNSSCSEKTASNLHIWPSSWVQCPHVTGHTLTLTSNKLCHTQGNMCNDTGKHNVHKL